MQEDFDNRISELQKEYEAKLKESSKKKPSATDKTKTLSQKGKDIADQIRKLKIQKGDTALDVTFGLRNAAIEAVALLVEGGVTIAEAIRETLKDAKYKGLSEDELSNHIIDGLKYKIRQKN
jgi:ribosomal protein L22